MMKSTAAGTAHSSAGTKPSRRQFMVPAAAALIVDMFIAACSRMASARCRRCAGTPGVDDRHEHAQLQDQDPR